MIEPVRITTSDKQSDEKIHVFSIDDRDYFMPAVVPASLALQVLDKMRTTSENAALGWVLEKVLGREAYDALLTCDSLSATDLKRVMKVVTEHVLGQLEETKGNS